MIFAHFLHIVLAIGKYTDVFRGVLSGGWGVKGSGFTWEDLSKKEFIMGEENFHEGTPRFSSII